MIFNIGLTWIDNGGWSIQNHYVEQFDTLIRNNINSHLLLVVWVKTTACNGTDVALMWPLTSALPVRKESASMNLSGVHGIRRAICMGSDAAGIISSALEQN